LQIIADFKNADRSLRTKLTSELKFAVINVGLRYLPSYSRADFNALLDVAFFELFIAMEPFGAFRLLA